MRKKSFRKSLAQSLAAPCMAAALAALCGGTVLSLASTAPAAEIQSQEDSGDEDRKAGKAEDGIPADEWLPIGSVVQVSGYRRAFMILGRAIQNASDGKYYDYCSCLYPDGYLGGDIYFFNHDDIETVESKGFVDEYETMYCLQNLDGVSTKELTKKAEEGEAESESETLTEASAVETPESESESEGRESEMTSESEEESEGRESEMASESETESEEESGGLEEGRTFTTNSNVRLREDATTDSETLATIPAGRQVEEDTSRKSEDDWIPVIFIDSGGQELKGYIKGEFLDQ